MSKNVVYISSKELISECNRIPVIKNRASLVDSLLRSYDVLWNKLDKIQSMPCTVDDLKLFHSQTYIEYLKSQNETNDLIDDDDVTEEAIEYGLGYDCPQIDRIYDFSRVIAGGTLAAVNSILDESATIAINWCGGWHHAQRDEAGGFCYVNDIAIGIQKLRSKFQRILYLDLDVHHGDGIENAFSTTKRVITMSFHQHGSGYFPGTGGVKDCGFGPGKGYSINIPYKAYMSGTIFIKYFLKFTALVRKCYDPDMVVVQCGGDVISGDPIGQCNLTPIDMGNCLTDILSWGLPIIALGGGGYNLTNTARYWTYLTSILTGVQLSNDIPDHEYFLEYGPDYELHLKPIMVPDLNVETELDDIYKCLVDNLNQFNVKAV